MHHVHHGALFVRDAKRRFDRRHVRSPSMIYDASGGTYRAAKCERTLCEARNPKDALTAEKMNSIEKRWAAKMRLTPSTGANLVGLDDFESDPDVELYLIRWYPTKEAAEAAQKRRKLKEPDEITYVYAADDG